MIEVMLSMNRWVFVSYSFAVMSRPTETSFDPSTENAVSTAQSSWDMLKKTCSPVVVSKTLGALPVGLLEDAIYFVRDTSGDTFKVAATAGGAAVDVTVAGVALVRQIIPEHFGGQGTYTVTSLSLSQS